MSVTDPGSARHDESTARLPRTEQTLPTVQGEKAASPEDETGDMMKAPPAEHVLALRVQHEVDEVQPSVQSWMAWAKEEEGVSVGSRGGGERERGRRRNEEQLTPKLWPVS